LNLRSTDSTPSGRSVHCPAWFSYWIGKEAGYNASLAACVTSNTYELCVSRYESCTQGYSAIMASRSASFLSDLESPSPSSGCFSTCTHVAGCVAVRCSVLQCVASYWHMCPRGTHYQSHWNTIQKTLFLQLNHHTSITLVLGETAVLNGVLALLFLLLLLLLSQHRFKIASNMHTCHSQTSSWIAKLQTSGFQI